MTGTVLLLATLATKADEAAYLTRRLTDHGATVRTIDISLETSGKPSGEAIKLPLFKPPLRGFGMMLPQRLRPIQTSLLALGAEPAAR